MDVPYLGLYLSKNPLRRVFYSLAIVALGGQQASNYQHNDSRFTRQINTSVRKHDT